MTNVTINDWNVADGEIDGRVKEIKYKENNLMLKEP